MRVHVARCFTKEPAIRPSVRLGFLEMNRMILNTLWPKAENNSSSRFASHRIEPIELRGNNSRKLGITKLCHNTFQLNLSLMHSWTKRSMWRRNLQYGDNRCMFYVSSCDALFVVGRLTQRWCIIALARQKQTKQIKNNFWTVTRYKKNKQTKQKRYNRVQEADYLQLL